MLIGKHLLLLHKSYKIANYSPEIFHRQFLVATELSIDVNKCTQENCTVCQNVVVGEVHVGDSIALHCAAVLTFQVN